MRDRKEKNRVCDRKRDKPGKIASAEGERHRERKMFSFLPFSSRPTPQARTGADLHSRTD